MPFTATLRLVRFKIWQSVAVRISSRDIIQGGITASTPIARSSSGGYYSFDPDCTVYYKKSGGTPPQNIKGEPSSGLRRQRRCYGVALVTSSEMCAVSREESGCQPCSLWRGTLIGSCVHLRLGPAHYRADRCRDGKLEGGYIAVAQ